MLDVPAVVLDADVDAGLIDTLMERLRWAVAATAPEARGTPELVRGTFGPDAGALGAATLPMFFNFSPRAGILMGAGAQMQTTSQNPTQMQAQAQEVSHVAL